MNDRLPYAPVFSRTHIRTHIEFPRRRFDDTPRSRPGPVPSQTVREARARGMGAPETLGWRPDLAQDA